MDMNDIAEKVLLLFSSLPWPPELWDIITGVVLISLWIWVSKHAANQKSDFDNLRIKLAEAPLQTLKNLFAQLGSEVVSDGNEAKTISNKRAVKVVKDIAEVAKKQSQKFNDDVSKHVSMVMAVMRGDMEGENKDNALAIWRIVGGVISFVLLLIFIYADLLQGINNVTLLFPTEMENVKYGWMKELWPSIIISSVGTVFTLSFIIFDTRGVTHFLPWDGVSLSDPSEKESLRRQIYRIALGTLLLTIILLALIALPRATTASRGDVSSSTLNSYATETSNRFIYNIAAFAHVLLIIPTLITTALLFWGAVGVVALYAAVAEVLRLFSVVLKGTVFLINKTIEVLEPTGDLFMKLILAIIFSTFVIFGLVIGTVLIIVEGITHAVVAIVQVVFYPFIFLDSLLGRLRRG